jgi:hypothetical protein
MVGCDKWDGHWVLANEVQAGTVSLSAIAAPVAL